MIAKVIVDQKTNDNLTFDYLIDHEENLDRFTLVEVNFARKKILGLVDGFSKNSSFKLKKIERILSHGAIFTLFQDKLVHIMSKEYFSSYSQTIFSFLPPLNIRDLKNLGFHTIKLRQKSKNQKQLIIAPETQRIEHYCQILQKSGGDQNLIVLPTVSEIVLAAEKLKKILPYLKVFIWHSQTPRQQRAKIWQFLLSGQDGVVISTRQGLLLPFTRLKNIFIDDPQNFAYQEDRAPYYNAYFVARALAGVTSANLYIGEDTPDITSFTGYLKNELKPIELKVELRTIVMDRIEKAFMQASTVDNLGEQLKLKRKIVVVGPWREYFRHLCLDCKNEIICEHCKNKYFKVNEYDCRECQSPVNLTACPVCQSFRIKKIGYSKSDIQKFINTYFPSFQKQFTYLTVDELTQQKNYFDIALLPYFTTMINLPYLRARQKIFKLVRSLNSFGIQNVYLFGEKLDESEFVAKLKKNDWKGFLLDELKERKKLKLPPFSKSFLIKSRNKNFKYATSHLRQYLMDLSQTAEIISQSEENGEPKAIIIVQKEKLKEFDEKISQTKLHDIQLIADPPDFS